MKKRKPETRNSKPKTLPCRVYPCPQCKTQNFATRARLRQAVRVPLTCWKCGEEIQIPLRHGRNAEERKKSSGAKRGK